METALTNHAKAKHTQFHFQAQLPDVGPLDCLVNHISRAGLRARLTVKSNE